MPTQQHPPTSGYRIHDRRAAIRYLFDPDWPLIAAIDQFPWRAEVLDLSSGGLRFRSPISFRPGRLLALELIGPGSQHSETLTVLVVHVAGDDDHYTVGAAFVAPLSADHMQVFLAWRGR